MQIIRKSNERGHFNHGWLDTYHTFSFAEYHDPKWMAFRSLRVINEDTVRGGEGFPPHPHRDMEIITYIISGLLKHEDSAGHSSVITTGEFQKFSAGRGIVHSEFNASTSEPVHLIQIWIMPERRGLPPMYAELKKQPPVKPGELRLVAAHGGGDNILPVSQEMKLYLGVADSNAALKLGTEKSRGYFIQVTRGSVTVNGTALSSGDALCVEDSTEPLSIEANEKSGEVLLFDL